MRIAHEDLPCLSERKVKSTKSHTILIMSLMRKSERIEKFTRPLI